MIHRLFRAFRRLLDRWFCSRPAPDLETTSDPAILMEARPRQPISEPQSEDDVLETFSEPAIFIEAQPRQTP